MTVVFSYRKACLDKVWKEGMLFKCCTQINGGTEFLRRNSSECWPETGNGEVRTEAAVSLR